MKPACIVCGGGLKRGASKFCSPSCAAVQRYGGLRDLICANPGCLKLFHPRNHRQRYCSRACYWAQPGERLSGKFYVRTCRGCGAEFIASRPNQLYHSRECRQRKYKGMFRCPVCRETKLVWKRRGRATCSVRCTRRVERLGLFAFS